MTHENIMDECKTKPESMLQATGLRDNGHPQATPQAKQDDPASALFKQQAGKDLDRKRQAGEMNAFRQREATHNRKVQALKGSRNNQPRKQFVNNKFDKGWKNNNKGYGKGHDHDQYKKQHKGPNNSKGKNKCQ